MCTYLDTVRANDWFFVSMTILPLERIYSNTYFFSSYPSQQLQCSYTADLLPYSARDEYEYYQYRYSVFLISHHVNDYKYTFKVRIEHT